MCMLDFRFQHKDDSRGDFTDSFTPPWNHKLHIKMNSGKVSLYGTLVSIW